MLSSVYSVHGSASEVNRSSVDAQVVSRHRYLVVFHPFVEQLTAVFHTYGFVLPRRRLLTFESSIDLDQAIISSMCQRGT